MPEYIIVRCAECHRFQGNQLTKSNKWTCKICSTKQSICKIYEQSSTASQLRPIIQRLNAAQGDLEEKRFKKEIQEKNVNVNDDVNLDIYTDMKSNVTFFSASSISLPRTKRKRIFNQLDNCIDDNSYRNLSPQQVHGSRFHPQYQSEDCRGSICNIKHSEDKNSFFFVKKVREEDSSNSHPRFMENIHTKVGTQNVRMEDNHHCKSHQSKFHEKSNQYFTRNGSGCNDSESDFINNYQNSDRTVAFFQMENQNEYENQNSGSISDQDHNHCNPAFSAEIQKNDGVFNPTTSTPYSTNTGHFLEDKKGQTSDKGKKKSNKEDLLLNTKENITTRKNGKSIIDVLKQSNNGKAQKNSDFSFIQSDYLDNYIKEDDDKW